MCGTQTWREDEELPKMESEKVGKKGKPSQDGTPKKNAKRKDEAKDEKPASPLPVPTHRRRTKSYRALAGQMGLPTKMFWLQPK